MERNALKSLIREELVKALGPTAGAAVAPPRDATRPGGSFPDRAPAPFGCDLAGKDASPLINRDQVMAAREKGRLEVPAGAIFTPLARETAEQYKIRIVVAAAEQPRTSGEGHFVVGIASDHGGFAMKGVLIKHIEGLAYPVLDLGPSSADPVDYPDFARAVAETVAAGRAARGIMIDGVGIGSTMAANKVPGIRAAMCTDLFEVNNSREHNDANVLCLGGRTIGDEAAKAMVTKWLETPFAGGRHQKRVDKIMEIEQRYLSRQGAGRIA